jgi:hypothetical protein
MTQPPSGSTASTSKPMTRQEKSTAIVVLVGLAALLVTCIGTKTFIPDGWGWYVFFAVIAVGFSALLATAAPSAAGKISVVLAGLLVAAAVLCANKTGTRPITVTAVVVGLGLLPVGWLFLTWEDVSKGRSAGAKTLLVTLRIAASLGLAASALGVVGWYETDRAAYAIKYGSPVNIGLPNTCVHTTTYSRTGVSDSTSCSGATWTIDGVNYKGTLHLDYSDLSGGMPTKGGSTFTNTSVQGYAVAGRDDAFTAQESSAKSDGLTAWGRLPRWLTLALPLTAGFGLVRLIQARRKALKAR